ncbi:MAG: hypothetical protein KKB50_13785 [Planctomycetes bacterium]|nr:hypothetical protein [Planctomycetota bacterium]
MWIERLLASPTTHAAELAARFAEERHNVLVENVANIDTPDYHTKRLDQEAFQASLREALGQAEQTRAGRLELRGNAQFVSGPGSGTEVRPVTDPAPNVLFHDGTNARMEDLMSAVAKNALYYQMASNLLNGRFDALTRAIRGRTT